MYEKKKIKTELNYKRLDQS